MLERIEVMTTDNDDKDEKSHTFRKRRLTFPTHHLDGAAKAAAAVAELDNEDDSDPDGQTEGGDQTQLNNHSNDKAKQEAEGLPNDQLEDQEEDDGAQAYADHESPLRDDSEKSRTFRKRRLTLTSNSVQGAATAMFHIEDAEFSNVKKRRMSEMSHSSMSTMGSTVRTTIHHAGEILRQPPSPSVAPQNRLYAGPHNLEHDVTEEEKKSQPRWKRRMTRRHSEDETKLPFPRSVVGQFSCHGIEPVYDSDYEHTEDDEDEDDEWLSEIPREDGTMVARKVTTSAKINQDRGGIAFPYGKHPKTALFAVYDGHGQGGELVSQYALHHIQQKLRKHANFTDNIEKAFKETFLTVDEELKDEPTIEPLYAGTTACVALLRDNTLTISNAGDSRAVIARKKKDGSGFETLELSEDQNPDNPDEQARIEYCGGYVSPPPEPGLSARVWLDSSCTQIGLAMSRSIGDHAVKDVGVIAEPVVTQHDVKPEDDFLILASDGVWEFMTSQEAVDLVVKNLPHGGSKACQALIEAAANKWHEEEGDYRDDITALVIRLQKVWDALI